MTLSVAIITLNEEKNIEACLETVKWANEIVLVDSGSTDKTLEKARAYTSKIYSHPFKDFSSQKNEAIKHATQDWVFILDADERVTPALAQEINETIQKNQLTAYKVKRLTHFFQKPLRHSGTQNDAPIRLFPRGRAHYDQPVHEQIVTDLPVRSLTHYLEHHTTKDRAQYNYKLQQYIPLEIQAMKQNNKKPSWIKMLLQPPAKFIFLYFFKLGFMDGSTGLQFALLSAYYDFLKHQTYLKEAKS
jgi:glycosyltransferase involved in cell wall biosynthesis